MPKRPCLGLPGQPCRELATGPRCPMHQRQVDADRQRSKRARRPRPPATEDRRRAEAVAAWIATHGHWCPGWRREPHPSTDLTADHVVAFANNRNENSQLAVLCRSCNSRKRDSE
jgi:5-methylcytosine-specific restriction enzyme A